MTFYTWENFRGKFQCFAISSIFAFSQSTINFFDCVMESNIEIKMHHIVAFVDYQLCSA